MDNPIESLKSKLSQVLTQSSIYQNTLSWYAHLTLRDQAFVKGLGVLVAVALLYTWLWQPSVDGVKKAEARYAKEMKFHEKMKSNAHLFSNNGTASKGFNGSVLSAVNNLAKTKNIQLKRFEPDGDRGLRVWLDKANFNSVIDWIETLESQKGIMVEQISIDKVAPGTVNLRAVFKA